MTKEQPQCDLVASTPPSLPLLEALYEQTDFPSLDVRRLQSAGQLPPGHTFALAYRGEHRPSLLARLHADFVEIHHRAAGGAWDADAGLLALAWSPCNLGGRRAWFLCLEPDCKHQVVILYAKGHGTYACRLCLNLAYPSQRERAAGRARLKAESIRERLGWRAGILNPQGDKPAGMKSATFRRLVETHGELVEVALRGMLKGAHFKGTGIEPVAPGIPSATLIPGYLLPNIAP